MVTKQPMKETFASMKAMKTHESQESNHQKNIERQMGEKNVLKPAKKGK